MGLKRIDIDTSQVSALFKIEQASSFKGILLHFGGLTNAAAAQTANELGRLKYRIRGKSIIDADVQYLMALNKLKGGFPHYTVAAAGLFDVTCYIPRWFGRGLPDNVEFVTKEDLAELELVYNFANAPQTFYAEVYLDLHEGVQSYHLTYHQIAETAAASQVITETYTEENILGFYVADVAANLLTTVAGNWFAATYAAQGHLDFTIGHLHNVANTHAWRVISDYLNNVEAAQVAPCCCEVYTAEGDQINNKLFDQVLVNITNGSGGASTPTLLFVGAKVNPYKMADTQARQTALFSQKVTEKDRAGHFQTSSVLKKIPLTSIAGS